MAPFLEVIRSEDVNDGITGLALTSVDKFLSYGLLDVNTTLNNYSGFLSSIAIAAEAIADAGTQVRFVGNDPRSAEVSMFFIISVLFIYFVILYFT